MYNSCNLCVNVYTQNIKKTLSQLLTMCVSVCIGH